MQVRESLSEWKNIKFFLSSSFFNWISRSLRKKWISDARWNYHTNATFLVWWIERIAVNCCSKWCKTLKRNLLKLSIATTATTTTMMMIGVAVDDKYDFYLSNERRALSYVLLIHDFQKERQTKLIHWIVTIRVRPKRNQLWPHDFLVNWVLSIYIHRVFSAY